MHNPESIIDAFNIVSPDYAVTRKLAQDLHKFESSFVNRPGHADFFSGNLLGVNRVIFTPRDESQLIDEIIKLDDIELGALIQKVPFFRDKDSELKTASKPINLMLVWLVHRFSIDKTLPEAVRREAMVDCMLILQYIMYTSALFNFFGRYSPSQELMEAVTESMSMKFNIRKYKTWRNYFRAMAMTIFNADYIHRTILGPNPIDYDFVYTISDNKTRINSIMKNHYVLINEVKDSDTHIRKTKLFVETPDGVEIKSLQRELPGYRDYIHSIVGDQASFIKEDILEATYLLMSRKQPDGLWKPQCKESLVLKTLQLISERHDIDSAIYDLIDSIMIHAFEYLYTSGFDSKSVIPLDKICVKLKGLYQSSLGSNEKLLSNRKVIEKLITKNFKGNSVAAVKSTRTAVMLYVVIRGLAKRSFS